MKTHLVDRRTRLKNSSYKPGLKVLGEKINPLTLIDKFQLDGGSTHVTQHIQYTTLYTPPLTPQYLYFCTMRVPMGVCVCVRGYLWLGYGPMLQCRR